MVCLLMSSVKLFLKGMCCNPKRFLLLNPSKYINVNFVWPIDLRPLCNFV